MGACPPPGTACVPRPLPRIASQLHCVELSCEDCMWPASAPPTGCFKKVISLKLSGIFSLWLSLFCLKFCKFVGSSYPHVSTIFCIIELFYNTIAACQRPVGPLLSNKRMYACMYSGLQNDKFSGCNKQERLNIATKLLEHCLVRACQPTTLVGCSAHRCR